jgi:hypothetical protein
MKAYWVVEVYLHVFLTSEVGGGEWLASRPGRFTARERSPGTRWIGGWRGGGQSRSGRGGEERKFQILPGLEPPISRPISQRYTTETYINVEFDDKMVTNGRILKRSSWPISKYYPDTCTGRLWKSTVKLS